MMKSILTTIAFLALAVSGLAQTRSVIVNTSGVVQSPTNFWSADVTNARSGLGLGTAATNPATAFQPSSLVLSNLASSNGSELTNLTAANITGAIAISNGGSGATTVGGARTNFGLGATWLTNALSPLFTDTNGRIVAPLVVFDSANESEVLRIPSDTGDSQDPVVLGAGWNTSNNRTRLGLGPTNSPHFAGITFQEDEQSLSNSIVASQQSVEFKVANVSKMSMAANSMDFTVPLRFFGTNTAAATRTNLGATTVGNAVFTATNAAAAATAIGLGTTNDVTFNKIRIGGDFSIDDVGVFYWNTNARFSFETMEFFAPFSFPNPTNAATTRTNLGLGWSALTNTNTVGFNTSLYGSGTNPVLYNTNGEVVSPTNFWQVAPIVTRFVESQPTTNQTTNITAARNLHIHSLAISTTGVTNIIALPTTNSFDGDIALVVHQGPTSSVTQVRTQGSTNNLVTMNRFEEAVEFVYYNNVWQFNHNQSFVEPIYFSGTNAAANAAASRTNLGATTVGDSVFTATNQTAAQTAIFGTNAEIRNSSGIVALSLSDGETKLVSPISFPYLNGSVAAATSRTNLGIPLAALTNTSNANFQAAIFNTNSAPTNAANVNAVNFNTAIHWMEVNVATNGVTNNFRIPLFK